MTIGVAVVLRVPYLGVSLPLLLYQRGRSYKEINRVGYKMISIRTLSKITYFIYVFIDIIIYVLRSQAMVL
jgi:Trk-type K+ transport system membrane component